MSMQCADCRSSWGHLGQALAAIDEALFLGEVTTREEALALAAQIAHADEERLG